MSGNEFSTEQENQIKYEASKYSPNFLGGFGEELHSIIGSYCRGRSFPHNTDGLFVKFLSIAFMGKSIIEGPRDMVQRPTLLGLVAGGSGINKTALYTKSMQIILTINKVIIGLSLEEEDDSNGVMHTSHLPGIMNPGTIEGMLAILQKTKAGSGWLNEMNTFLEPVLRSGSNGVAHLNALFDAPNQHFKQNASSAYRLFLPSTNLVGNCSYPDAKNFLDHEIVSGTGLSARMTVVPATPNLQVEVSRRNVDNDSPMTELFLAFAILLSFEPHTADSLIPSTEDAADQVKSFNKNKRKFAIITKMAEQSLTQELEDICKEKEVDRRLTQFDQWPGNFQMNEIEAYLADSLIAADYSHPNFIQFKPDTEAYEELDSLLKDVAGEVNGSGETGKDTKDMAKSAVELIKWAGILTLLDVALELLVKVDGLSSNDGHPGKLLKLGRKLCVQIQSDFDRALAQEPNLLNLTRVASDSPYQSLVPEILVTSITPEAEKRARTLVAIEQAHKKIMASNMNATPVQISPEHESFLQGLSDTDRNDLSPETQKLQSILKMAGKQLLWSKVSKAVGEKSTKNRKLLVLIQKYDLAAVLWRQSGGKKPQPQNMNFYIIKYGSEDFATESEYNNHLTKMKAVTDFNSRDLYEATLATQIVEEAKPVRCGESCICHSKTRGNALYTPPNLIFQADPQTVEYKGDYDSNQENESRQEN